MSDKPARVYTLLIEAKNDIPFPPDVIVNGEKVNCYGLMAGDKSEHHDEMQELLGELCEGGYLSKKYATEVKELLIASGYWGEDEDE